MTFKLALFTSIEPGDNLEIDDPEDTPDVPEGSELLPIPEAIMLIQDDKPIIIYMDPTNEMMGNPVKKCIHMYNGTVQGVLRFFADILRTFPHFVEMDPDHCETLGLFGDNDSHII